MNHPLPFAVNRWFECWNSGDIDSLPITNDFRHRSPFGEIEPRSRYLEIDNINREQFSTVLDTHKLQSCQLEKPRSYIVIEATFAFAAAAY